MTLTEDQEIGLEKLSTWIKTPPRKTIESLITVIDGAAGTGKTTIVKLIINTMGIDRRRIAVTAPTHQAKKVIEAATEFTSSTIQKLLGLRPNVNLDDFDIANPQFDPLGIDTMGLYSYIIIDESSMIGKDAFNLIIKQAINYNVRVIFIGDSYQLPPVNEKISLVFVSTPNIITLETIVRQGKDNPNALFLAGLRADIRNGNDINLNNYLAGDDSIINDKGYKFQNNKDFGTDLLAYLRSTVYENDAMHVRLLAWTNSSVSKWCEGLRKPLLKELALNQLNVGENLIGYSTLSDFRSGEILLQNSESYEIVAIEETETDYGIKGFYTTIRTEDLTETTHFIIDNIDKQKFTEMAHERWNAARTAPFAQRASRWSQFYNFKDKHLTMQDIYYKGMRITKDIYYAYGCTVHKS